MVGDQNGVAMTDLTVRRLRFDFSAPVPVVWQPANPSFSHAVNLMSFVAICFEKMIVEAVTEAKPLLVDPGVAAEADAFLRQVIQVDVAEMQVELAGFDLGKIEKVVEQRHEVLAGGVDVLEVGAIALVLDRPEPLLHHDV